MFWAVVQCSSYTPLLNKCAVVIPSLHPIYWLTKWYLKFSQKNNFFHLSITNVIIKIANSKNNHCFLEQSKKYIIWRKSYSFLNMDSSLSCYPAKMSCFPRSLEDVFRVTIFHLTRRLQDIFKTYLPDVFQINPQEIFKTSSRRLPRLLQDVLTRHLLENVLKTSWKTKQCFGEDVFKTSSTRLHQDEYLLGNY